MKSALLPHEAQSQRLLTCADLAALPAALPSGPVDFELNNGRLVIMTPPGDLHGAVQTKIVAQLFMQAESRGLGKVRTETGVILRRNPDRVVGPDAAFVASRSLPIQCSAEGYLETIPDLVAEVRSKNDLQADLDEKVDDYLAAGVRVVWILDPYARTVTAHRRDTPPQVFAEQATLAAEDVVPGFGLVVADLFVQ
ncbi:MAG: Uma2 family endonuclease [Pirellulales bacterium]